ncbi:hypothetical protein CBL_13038 [Carabus blaptoides fortunei]
MSPEHWAVSAGLVATSALALIANALLLLVFFRRRGLRTVSNRFVINLLITNLLSSLVLIPLLLVDQEFQPTDDVSAQTLILKTSNNSSRLTIENIKLQLDEELTTLAQTTDVTTLEEEEVDEDFELEILNENTENEPKENDDLATKEPFLQKHVIPEVVVTCKMENEKKSILKRVCSKGKNWGAATKKCNFIPVPECLSVECRCSFSSASTQVSSEDYSVCN